MSSGKRTFLIVCVFLVLEVTLFPILTQPRWIPAFSFIILIFSGLRFGARFGLAMGLFLGFCLDGLGAERFGLFMCVYGLSGWVCGRMAPMVFLESPVTQCLIPGLLYMVLQLGFLLGTPLEQESPKWALFLDMIRNSPLLVTVIASPFVYRLYDHMLGGGRTS